MELFRSDVKSGIFIIAALVLLIAGIFQVGGLMERLRPSRQLILQFEDAQQVTNGTEVLFRGKRIGRVSSVDFSDDANWVHIACNISPESGLTQGVRARISDKSMLGGKMIEILPALAANRSNQPLPEDAVVKGEASGGLTAAIEAISNFIGENTGKFDQILVNTQRLTNNLDGAVSEARQSLAQYKDLPPQVSQTLSEYTGLAKDLRVQLTKLEGQLARVVDQVEPLAGDIRGELKNVSHQLRGDVSYLRGKMDETLTAATQLTQDADHLILDNYTEFRQTLLALRQTLQNLEVFTAKVAAKPSSIVWRSQDEPYPPQKPQPEAGARELSSSGQIGRKGGDGKGEKQP